MLRSFWMAVKNGVYLRFIFLTMCAHSRSVSFCMQESLVFIRFIFSSRQLIPLLRIYSLYWRSFFSLKVCIRAHFDLTSSGVNAMEGCLITVVLISCSIAIALQEYKSNKRMRVLLLIFIEFLKTY